MNFIIITFLIIQNYAFSSSSSRNSYQYESNYYYPNSMFYNQLHIDQNFKSEIISTVAIYWRKVKWILSHPDIVFTLQNDQEVLIIGFHSDNHRYDVTRTTTASFYSQQSSYYNSKEYVYLRKPVTVLKVLQIADRVAMKPYSYLFNNCKDSAYSLIDILNR
ncbi:unnamed protein product [Paramecium octaurelia]|uniref:DUF4105 domain-containing protein n=1 Tax=Paramecium octaurelia TaxID=43137 RepID=A0A8S1V279_PAROT|nr:unnamed protein product [Paramecium octaurelia]